MSRKVSSTPCAAVCCATTSQPRSAPTWGRLIEQLQQAEQNDAAKIGGAKRLNVDTGPGDSPIGETGRRP